MTHTSTRNCRRPGVCVGARRNILRNDIFRRAAMPHGNLIKPFSEHHISAVSG